MKKTVLVFLLLFLSAALFSCAGNKEENTRNAAEVVEKKVIGYVEAEPIYQINIDSRIKLVSELLRVKKSIFYQPNPQELLAMNYVSLLREIRKVGLKIPGMKPEKVQVETLAKKLMDEKTEKIIARLKEGAEVKEIKEEFTLTSPDAPQEISEGDERIWNTEVGGVSEPVYDDVNQTMFIFRVIDKGRKGLDRWAKVEIMYFQLPKGEAQKALEDEKSKNWNIRFTNGFYSALMKYYDSDIQGTIITLKEYFSKDGQDDDIAHYFLANIYQKLRDAGSEQVTDEQIQAELQKAADTCDDSARKPFYRYKLGLFFLKIGDRGKALENFHTSMNEMRNDLELARNLMNTFIELGDKEYETKAAEKKKILESQIRAEIIAQPIATSKRGVIQTGEGLLNEIPEDILVEVEEANVKESKIDFTRFTSILPD